MVGVILRRRDVPGSLLAEERVRCVDEAGWRCILDIVAFVTWLVRRRAVEPHTRAPRRLSCDLLLIVIPVLEAGGSFGQLHQRQLLRASGHYGLVVRQKPDAKLIQQEIHCIQCPAGSADAAAEQGGPSQGGVSTRCVDYKALVAQALELSMWHTELQRCFRTHDDLCNPFGGRADGVIDICTDHLQQCLQLTRRKSSRGGCICAYRDRGWERHGMAAEKADEQRPRNNPSPCHNGVLAGQAAGMLFANDCSLS
mmetsp:Transcript_50862/g.129382  ORF Transcript_50862/g.129382 Transcript_50862/m.129382 type:complete len:254 (+) Transcript_50862:782-1543(+)